MESYIVGGYVRDKLLGLHPRDRDWVVVGSSIEEMLAAGFQLVGREFPVFLHPQTAEAYALARTSKQHSQQHQGRQVYTGQNVSLEEDLARRDLTINAMAMTADGELIDPFGGKQDLEAKRLRHVSPSFREDPVRVLRTARFAARYDFHIASETLALIQDMATAGELDELVAERVWAELLKALTEIRPDRFIAVLHEMTALQKIFPEIDCLFGVPQPEKHHPEIDTGAHLLLALQRAAALSPDPLVRFGVLVHDLGKGITDKAILPRHIGHEKAGVKLVDRLCQRYRIPNSYQRFGRLCAEYHLHMHRAFELKAKTLVKLFEKIGAFKQPENLERYLLVCQADAQGRKGLQDLAYPQRDYVSALFNSAASVTNEDIINSGVIGKAFGDRLQRKRVQAVINKIQQLSSDTD